MNHHVLLVLSAYYAGEKRHVDAIRAGLNTRYQFSIIAPYTQPLMGSVNGTYAIQFLGSWLSIIRYIKEFNPSVIHCHGFRAMLLIRVLRMLGCIDVPIVSTVHGFHFIYGQSKTALSKMKRYCRLRFEQYLAQYQQATIAVGQSDYDALLTYRCAQLSTLHYIPNGIDMNEVGKKNSGISAQLNALNINENESYIVLSMARLSTEKGGDLIVQLASMLTHTPGGIPIKYILVGDGPERGGLDRYICNNNLENTVFLMGHQANNLDWYAYADLFIMPSRWEGLPYALLEAMVNRVPVLGMDSPGVRDVIQVNKTGGLFESESVSDFKLKCEFMMGTPCDSMVEMAWEMCDQHYSQAAMLRGLDAVYRRIIESNYAVKN